MKSVRLHTYGDPDVLVYEDTPRLEPKSDEVGIQVYSAGVNPIDWQIRAGYLKEKFPFKLPLTLGYDIAGIVVAVGSGVSNLRIGDLVYAMLPMNSPGGYAEYVTTKAILVAHKPHSLDYTEAAAVPLVSLTAWQSLFDVAALQSGQTVLIHGASGGVGGFAVQLAKWKGAHVIGTASTANLIYVRQLGADRVIDYKKQPFEQVVKDVDVVFDTVGGETRQRSWKTLRSGGILVSTQGAAQPVVSPIAEVRGLPIFVDPKDNMQLQQIAQLIDKGQVKVTVEKTFRLIEAAKAHEISQQGHRQGKVVLQVAD